MARGLINGQASCGFCPKIGRARWRGKDQTSFVLGRRAGAVWRLGRSG